jgi:hypothetical protein
MAIIQASGIANSDSTCLSRGSIEYKATGVTSPVSICLSKVNMEYMCISAISIVSGCLGHLAMPPRIESIVALNSTTVRLTFDRPMLKNLTLSSVWNYSITPITPGAANVYVSEITPRNVANPTYVDIKISEMTGGATYNCAVNVVGPTDLEGVYVDAAYDDMDFIGVGDAPTIARCIAIGANRVDVVFSEKIKKNLYVMDSSNYSFDNGLVVLGVLNVDDNTVQLSTTDQAPGVLYTLTVG